jgi:4'-phosphopantetheinyl transferase
MRYSKTVSIFGGFRKLPERHKSNKCVHGDVEMIPVVVRPATLNANEVHVWRIPLAVEEDVVHSCRGLLSHDEILRADRFYFKRDRDRFTAARGALRRILAEYQGATPEDLAFSYAEKGKPELAPGVNAFGTKFNLSHSKDFALLAVACGLTVGVDIEFINPEFAGDEIATRFFCQNEVRTLRALAPSEQTEAFFQCWTRKEAYIKALGDGLSLPLDSFEVAFGPGIRAALLWTRDASHEISKWSVYNIIAPEEYAAALVAEGKDHVLRSAHWEY